MFMPFNYSAGGMPLVTAAAKGDVATVQACLQAGADVHYDSDLALRCAAFTGNLTTLKVLVEAGAYVNANNEEALLYAGKRRDADMVQYLIDKGANANTVFEHHAQDIDNGFLETLDKLHSKKLTENFEKQTEALKKISGSGNRFRKPF